jgi:hypothetical protein
MSKINIIEYLFSYFILLWLELNEFMVAELSPCLYGSGATVHRGWQNCFIINLNYCVSPSFVSPFLDSCLDERAHC